MPTQEILDTLAAGDGYGKITLRAGADGALAHFASVIYIKPQPGETIAAFLRRLQLHVQPGDQAELDYQRGVLQLARITRSAALAPG